MFLGVAERPLAPPQGLDQFGIGLEPFVGPFGHHPRDDGLDLRGDVGRERVGFRLLDLLEHLEERIATERGLAREHLIEGRAEREDVGPVVDATGVGELLGRHVAGRAEGGAGRGVGGRHFLGHDLRQPQVGELHLPAPGEQDVGRLDVAVDQPDLVERLAQRLGDRLGDLHGSPDGDGVSLAEVSLQRLPIDELHDDVEVPVGLAAVEDADDARRLEAGGQPGLAEEPVGDAGLLREVGVQELDRHVEVEVAVAAPVDDAHAPLADPREELAPPDGGQSQVRIVGHAAPPTLSNRHQATLARTTW